MKKTAKKTAKKPAVRRTGAPAAARAAAPVSVVILAAGQGKRMRSDLPKVLQPLAGKPLLQHVLDTAARLDAAALPVVVYGHGGEHGPRRAGTDRCRCTGSLQAEQRGTGHAAAAGHARSVPDDHQVLVLYGDVPLLRAETLRGLLALAAAAHRSRCSR
jgi:bifunctional UDP-N-acetylglucosamine pyrophosphorylase/glucosamine-1-phosphate N-acetyltransferase